MKFKLLLRTLGLVLPCIIADAESDSNFTPPPNFVPPTPPPNYIPVKPDWAIEQDKHYKEIAKEKERQKEVKKQKELEEAERRTKEFREKYGPFLRELHDASPSEPEAIVESPFNLYHLNGKHVHLSVIEALELRKVQMEYLSNLPEPPPSLEIKGDLENFHNACLVEDRRQAVDDAERQGSSVVPNFYSVSLQMYTFSYKMKNSSNKDVYITENGETKIYYANRIVNQYGGVLYHANSSHLSFTAKLTHEQAIELARSKDVLSVSHVRLLKAF